VDTNVHIRNNTYVIDGPNGKPVTVFFKNRAGRRAQLSGAHRRGPKAFKPLRDTTGIYGNASSGAAQ
jgi:hypothetical protein